VAAFATAVSQRSRRAAGGTTSVRRALGREVVRILAAADESAGPVVD
jgi:hypothetical protein